MILWKGDFLEGFSWILVTLNLYHSKQIINKDARVWLEVKLSLLRNQVIPNDVNHIDIRIALDRVEIFVGEDVLIRDVEFSFPGFRFGRSTGDNCGEVAIFSQLNRRRQQVGAEMSQADQSDAKFVFLNRISSYQKAKERNQTQTCCHAEGFKRVTS